MKLKGKDLIFISRILRDGSGVTDVSKESMKHLNEDKFRMSCLSITEKTYIACEFNSFVVKLKKNEV